MEDNAVCTDTMGSVKEVIGEPKEGWVYKVGVPSRAATHAKEGWQVLGNYTSRNGEDLVVLGRDESDGPGAPKMNLG